MSIFVFSNNLRTTLASPAANGATQLTLTSSANLPTLSGSQVMPLTLMDAATRSVFEVTYVIAINGATLTVLRGQEGTTQQNWLAGDYAFCPWTAETIGLIGMGENLFQYDEGTAANTYIINNPVPYTAFFDGMIVGMISNHANTGASTLEVDGMTPQSIYGSGLSALQGGEIPFDAAVLMQYRATLSAFVMLTTPGGPLQVSPAVSSGHAVNLGQFASGSTPQGSYQKLPNGSMRISGSLSLTPTTTTQTFTITLPMSLTSGASTVIAQWYGNLSPGGPTQAVYIIGELLTLGTIGITLANVTIGTSYGVTYLVEGV